MTTKLFSAMLLTLTASLTAGTQAAQATDYRNLYRASKSLQYQVDDAYDQIRYHFHYSPHYDHLKADIKQMDRAAYRLRRLARDGGCINEMNRVLKDLHGMLDHLNHTLVQAGYCPRDCRFRTLKYALRDIDRNLHYMHDLLHRHDYHTYRGRTVDYGYGYSSSRRSSDFGLTIGRRGAAVHVNRGGISFSIGR